MILLCQDLTDQLHTIFAAVVDDHDFEITDVIRGDDHLTNTARQKLIYSALGWQIPRFSHIPLIHSLDGKKLSKRHGAVGVNSYIIEGINLSALSVICVN